MIIKTETDEGDFSRFNISDQLVERLQARNIKTLFPVQYNTYDSVCAGKDMVVLARTGTGKTLAFSLPITHMLLQQSANNSKRKTNGPAVLVMAPTRELVSQITSDFVSLCASDLTVLSVYGGVPIGPQCRTLRQGVDVLIGTPGRLLDLLEREALSVTFVKHVVLDEVDRMLDMGFSKDVESIISQLYHKKAELHTSENPQTLLFSATMPSWVSSVASNYLSKDYERISLVDKTESKTALGVTHMCMPCSYDERPSTLADVIRIYSRQKESRCIVFCERKKDADELATHEAMSADCHVFHGDIPQDKRELILQKFRDGKYHTLITTNVAARGLDIPDVDLVVQCHPPRDAEDYVHRSGRTGRADRTGVSLVFYTPREQSSLQYIEQKVGMTFQRISAPTLQNIMESWGHELASSFVAVPEKTWSAFIPTVTHLIQSMSTEMNGSLAEKQKKKLKKKKSKLVGEDANLDDSSTAQDTADDLFENNPAILRRLLCCALARLSGKDGTVESRSLLNSRKGFVTYRLSLPYQAFRKGKAYMVLREQLADDIADSAKSMSFIKGHNGFVFDFPVEHSETVDTTWDNSMSETTLEPLDELPELELEEHNQRDSSYTNGSSRGFRGYGNRGRFGHQNGLSSGRSSFHGNMKRGFMGSRGGEGGGAPKWTRLG